MSLITKYPIQKHVNSSKITTRQLLIRRHTLYKATAVALNFEPIYLLTKRYDSILYIIHWIYLRVFVHIIMRVEYKISLIHKNEAHITFCHIGTMLIKHGIVLGITYLQAQVHLYRNNQDMDILKNLNIG